jgi:Domain of unknown function (DUF1772)
MDVLVFLNLLCCGIVTGTYVFEMVVVVPATGAAPPLLSAQIHRALFSHLPNRFMPWLGITGGLAAVALLVFESDSLSDSATVLYAVGIAFWLCTFVILVGMSRPIDKQITQWVETNFPESEYPAVRRRWDTLMFTRGPLGLAALACFIAAPLS